MKHLLIFTFSPVQGFISAARRPRDLFTGSYILSYLAEQVVKGLELEKRGKGKVIYPQLSELSKNLANYTNRVVALVEDEDIEKEARDIFNKTWECIYLSVLEQINLNEDAEKQFMKQVENYFNVFSVCIPMVNKQGWQEFLDISENIDAADYGYTYDLAERVLGAKKSWRPYHSIIDDNKYEGKHPNGCTMCGERLHLAISWDRDDLEDVFKKEDARHIRKGEKLCGVCLTKRFAVKYYFKEKLAGDFWHYPSTEEIAGAKFKVALAEKLGGDSDNEDIMQDVNSLMEEFKIKEGNRKGEYASYVLRKRLLEDDYYICLDSELFRKDGWEGLFKDMEYMLGKDKTQEIRKKVSALTNKIKERYGIEHKNPYYAILISDGDSVGDWLGIKTTIRKEPLSENFHMVFSKKLSEYAKDVAELWQEQYPRLMVYAGGEDIMALMHPFDVVTYASKCAQMFKNTVGDLAKEEKLASISAGALITHAKMSLQKALNEAGKLEKKAKDVKGKGAICLGVMTRSGNLTSFVAKWEDIGLYEELVNAFRNGSVSSSLAYDIRHLESSIPEDNTGIFLSLLRRVLKRKTDRNYEWEQLFTQMECFIKRTKHYLKDSPITNFANLLYVARFVGTLREVETDEIV
ncbi:type III-B CRISPR-associated protein Cas10/Cmr2 [Hydrogenivirga sp. 128-5-R1-1]|uniref:type III-B CRISPR-associated protein Cas10/Cmr2 n=1 Tax=Hydrogenivirga sp. 128-5-R1-1 TaxID=392423 RepID=UPI00015F0D19|nr:type III-B CRISPR-associated protein Cas10/Cmr2 [Hydrogenivirga sp. 128-5-R1-1]EDP75979.1 hypothetical protein HG1285_06620 [Hydrogenivirga sp. 128-5-R1-1]